MASIHELFQHRILCFYSKKISFQKPAHESYQELTFSNELELYLETFAILHIFFITDYQLSVFIFSIKLSLAFKHAFRSFLRLQVSAIVLNYLHHALKSLTSCFQLYKNRNLHLQSSTCMLIFIHIYFIEHYYLRTRL